MKRHAQRYCSTEEELTRTLESLSLCACPFCHMVGALIRNGKLKGYHKSKDNPKEVRGQRVICSARRKHKAGCGRTFSIVFTGMLLNFWITAKELWSYLSGVLDGKSKARSFKPLTDRFHPSNAYRLWARFKQAQSRIRGFLTRHCPRPKLPTTPSAATQTIAHLKSVFTGHSCPIAAFQKRFQVKFL